MDVQSACIAEIKDGLIGTGICGERGDVGLYIVDDSDFAFGIS